MAYLTEAELKALGFKHLGRNVKISSLAAIYNPERISISDNVRVDDFCILSGLISIGSYCHITPGCLIAGGAPGVFMDDFCTLAYGVKIFSQSDDYSGETMVNSLVPKKYKSEIFKAVHLARQTIIGAGSIIMPGADIAEGCSVGAMSLVVKPTEPWGIYFGIPATRRRERSKKLLELEAAFINENK
jgi:acetyltransferase-like isoleucine patch superfamily enzyme